MGTYYQDLDRTAFDYDLQPVAGISNQVFRGPAVDLSQPYIACVGAAQTFGRFCAKPYTHLLSERLGVQVLNLGVGGAGPALFDSPEYLELLRHAEAVVFQVLSGRSESNSLFDNRTSGDLHGTRTRDGKRIRFEEFLEELVTKEPPELVKRIVLETREHYVKNMVKLLTRVSGPRVLLWFSSRSPAYLQNFSSAWGVLGEYPQLVDQNMLNEIRAHSDGYAECVSNQGIPQALWKADHAIDGTTVKNGRLVNTYYPSPEMHAAAAELLATVCERFLSTKRMSVTTTVPPVAAETTRFIVVCAERTGSNVLLGMLDSHPSCLAAGELFNPRVIAGDNLPGMPDSPNRELASLRRTDPVSFIKSVMSSSDLLRYRAVGFKFMYGHADQHASVRDLLASQKDLRVIHLKRRNLLRRWLSEQRAHASDVWAERSGASVSAPPPVHLQFKYSIWNFAYIDIKEAEYDAYFAGHPTLELFYEELESDPEFVGRRALAFLGLDANGSLEIRFKKTGTDSLRQAIPNYDELKVQMLRWASFFEE